MFGEFYIRRLLCSVISSLILTFIAAVVSILDTIIGVGPKYIGINILIAIICTLFLSMPIAIILAPFVSYLVRNCNNYLKILIYTIFPAGIAYWIGSNFDSWSVAPFGALGGGIFYFLEWRLSPNTASHSTGTAA